MRNPALLACASLLLTVGAGQVPAQEELIYVAVEPCRIVNTRKSAAGPVKADTFRNFKISGTAQELASQGGRADCLNPKGAERPVAVSAYILAVPADTSTGQGVLTAYPSDQPPPPSGSGSTVNFDQGQTIGNTSIVTVCAQENGCPAGGELAILSRLTNEHVLIDVQGYFYPPTLLPGYEIVQKSFATANNNSVVAEAICPSGKKVVGGGGSLGNSSWVLDSSIPRPDGRGWQVRYKTPGDTFNASGFAWAVCVSAS